jgi:3-oxoadipate enol-lactonase
MTTTRQGDRMSRAPIDGIELEYETHGAGEPVVLIHGGLCADWFKVLLDQPELRDRHRLIRYHRVGYASSDRVGGPVSLHRQATHCASLMHHLGIA